MESRIYRRIKSIDTLFRLRMKHQKRAASSTLTALEFKLFTYALRFRSIAKPPRAKRAKEAVCSKRQLFAT